jgi:hypothetical protein
MRLLEKAIEVKTCRKVFDTMGVRSVKLSIGGNTGWPDRMFLIKGGKPLLIEFKAPGKQPYPRQVYIHDMLLGLGYEVQVHDNADDAVEAVRKAVEAARISAEGGEVFASARGGRSISRSRFRKDVDSFIGPTGALEGEDD